MIDGDRPRATIGLVVLALLAYVPALASSPGRMPADTKLYLYLDPAGLVGRAASTFEPDQFAGWVPHQQITYLWPSGPWFWFFDVIGMPDWIAHRLWIGTVLFAAGAGVRWAARHLGLAASAALVAAVVYQLAPYLLPYVSRTSLLLLPWAGVGWIVGLTVRATTEMATVSEERRTWRVRLRLWRDPALIALVVATVGSVNATALALIAPAPLLWLLHVGLQRVLPWGDVVRVAVRTAGLCLAASAWWIAMLFVQARYGAPVLAFSETLEDVSRNATGSEVMRGLGYWLFYQRNPIGPTTTASFDYLVSVRTMLLSYAVVLTGFVGLATVSWAQRRFAALCVAAGTVLAVGVHPLDDPSPLMRWFAGDDGSGLALALRSSTRATPVLLFGIALGAGALLSLLPRRVAAVRRRVGRITVPSAQQVAAAGLILLAIANLPALYGAELVDPAIDRDADAPAEWTEAGALLDADGHDGRVLQLPGAEFGAFRWGYTVDQPLVAISDDPLVTRDLLPLGSAAAMDLLYALDDRFQEEVAEPDSVAPVARFLGVDTIWLANDIEFERFRTPRPEAVDDLLAAAERPGGLGAVTPVGAPVVNQPAIPIIDPTTLVDPRIGTPLAPVVLVDVEDPGTIVRAKTATVVLSGSGDGVVDAGASDLLSGHELLRYSAHLGDAELESTIADADLLVVTDSNRDRAHHWRGSQDVTGHTEPGGPADDVLVPTAADQRLELFDDDADLQTVAVQLGPVTATASSYGEPFAYRPEDRAVMAIDGDATTAWTVGDHGRADGEVIRLTLSPDIGAPAQLMTLRQVDNGPGGRSISEVTVQIDDADPIDVVLDDRSFEDAGQPVDLVPISPGESFDVVISELAEGDPALAASRAGVGFVEVDLGFGPTEEFIRPPTRALDAAGDTPAALTLTRLRTSATDPWRSDPEPELRRLVDLADRRVVRGDVTIALDRRAPDADLLELFGPALDGEPPSASSRVTGGVSQWGPAAVDGDLSTSWVTPFDGAVGATLTMPSIRRLGTELIISQPEGDYSPVTAVELSTGDLDVDVALTSVGDGTWVGSIPEAFIDAVGSDGMTLTITGLDERTTIDRRYGDRITLPAAIAELTSTVGIGVTRVDQDAVVSADCRTDLLRIDGDAIPLSFSATVAELVAGDAVTATVCDGPIRLATGEHRIESTNSEAPGLTVDRVVLRDRDVPAPAPPSVQVETTVTGDEARRRTVEVAPCPDGCWLVLGEGWNEAWSATVAGLDLGAPQVVDGGFNGWLLPPNADTTTVELRWTAQGPVSWGLAFSLFAILGCIAIGAFAPRAAPRGLAPPTRLGNRAHAQRPVAQAITLVAAAGILVGPEWALVALVPAAAALLSSRRRQPSRNWLAVRPFEATGLISGITVAVWAVIILRNDRPFPDAGWTFAFDQLNGLAVFAALALAVGAAFAPDGQPAPPSV